MHPYARGALIVIASALVAGGGVATTSHDLWTIGVAVLVNIGTTLGGLLLQSPLPRKEWSEEERAAKAIRDAAAAAVKPA